MTNLFVFQNKNYTYIYVFLMYISKLTTNLSNQINSCFVLFLEYRNNCLIQFIFIISKKYYYFFLKQKKYNE